MRTNINYNTDNQSLILYLKKQEERQDLAHKREEIKKATNKTAIGVGIVMFFVAALLMFGGVSFFVSLASYLIVKIAGACSIDTKMDEYKKKMGYDISLEQVEKTNKE